MIRKAFVMSLKPGNQDEYIKRHNPIWPELQRVLKEHGVHNYSIFLERRSEKLFAYAELESEDRWQQIAETEISRRWWSFMKDLMLTKADDSPVALAVHEIFHLE